MARREARQYKALYFDIRINDLKKFFPKKNYLGAYADIKQYLLRHSFTHEQWSGYHSINRMSDLEIFDLVQDMANEMPWFSQCINHFEVTNVGTNYNLIDILEPVELELVSAPAVVADTGTSK